MSMKLNIAATFVPTVAMRRFGSSRLYMPPCIFGSANRRRLDADVAAS